MVSKEKNTGGEISNKELEEDLKVKGKPLDNKGGYVGMQDTGTSKPNLPEDDKEEQSKK